MQPPDNFTYLIPVEDENHTPEMPFCWDQSCDCHEDQVLIFEVYLHVRDGLMTPERRHAVQTAAIGVGHANSG